MNKHIAEQAVNDVSANVERKDSTDFFYEYEAPILKANIKESAEDFRVTEKLKFELSGQGQHLCLFIEKKFLNTQDALNILSRFFKVPPHAIGYFGLKDKVAVTQQWFSVDLASSEFDESHCDNFQTLLPQLLAQTMHAKNDTDVGFKRHPAQMKILEFKRNSKKFKIGQLARNGFEIVLRNIGEPSLDSSTDIKQDASKSIFTETMQHSLDLKLEYIKKNGFPNYFGEQRFGRDNQNIELLKKNINADLSKRRALRARVISTLRALVFNRYLSERLASKNARIYVEGDVLQFSDGNTLFQKREQEQGSSENIQQRLNDGDIVISGPLVGVDKSLASGASLEFEEMLLRKFRTYSPILERFQVKSARRALFARANNLTWYFLGNDLFLNFELTSGSFATSLIRELVNFRNNKVVAYI